MPVITFSNREILGAKPARRGIAHAAQHHAQVRAIDAYVKQTFTAGGAEDDLLRTLADHMSGFKQLLDTTTADEMDALCDYYDGFYRFAWLLEKLAAGIATGAIAVPK